jgi:hypothetical protein
LNALSKAKRRPVKALGARIKRKRLRALQSYSRRQAKKRAIVPADAEALVDELRDTQA